MLQQITHSGNTFLEVLKRVEDFVFNNGIKDIRTCNILPVVDPDTDETLGFTSVMVYTNAG